MESGKVFFFIGGRRRDYCKLIDCRGKITESAISFKKSNEEVLFEMNLKTRVSYKLPFITIVSLNVGAVFGLAEFSFDGNGNAFADLWP